MRNREQGCTEYVELIMQHLDGLLTPARSAELENHLAGCEACRAELLLQTRIHEALAEEIHPRLSIDFTNLITQKTLEAARPVRRRSTRLTLVPAFGFLAGTLFLFTVQNGFRDAFVNALGPTGNALASAAGGVGPFFSRALPRTGGAPNLDLSGLSGIAGPLTVTLLLLLCVLPVVWCFRRVGEFLSH